MLQVSERIVAAEGRLSAYVLLGLPVGGETGSVGGVGPRQLIGGGVMT